MTFTAPQNALVAEIHDGVGVVTLNRPEALNAVTPQLARALADTLAELPEDGSVRALLVTGAGKAFCSGGDVRAMSAALDDDPRQFFLELTESLHRVTLSLLNARVPTVAAVNGPAVGFGFGLALSCDLVLASERATFTMAHGQVGQIPDGGGWYLLPRVIGRKRALDMYLTRRELDAETAQEWGIVTETIPVSSFREVSLGFAREIAQGPTLAYMHAKRRLGEGWNQNLEAYLDEQRRVIVELGASRDFAEGVRAFLERRAPKFRGE